MEATTIFGILFDGAAVLAVFVYMPIANYFIRKHEEELSSDIPDDQWYEVEM